MQEIFKTLRNDYCIECDTPRALECYDIVGNPLQFTLVLDAIERGKDKKFILEDNILSHLKCKRCGHEFKIKWDKDGLPRPLSEKSITYRSFIVDYNKGDDNNEL